MMKLQETSLIRKEILTVIDSVKKQVAAGRSVSVKVHSYHAFDNIWS